MGLLSRCWGRWPCRDECRMQNAECRVQNALPRLHSAFCILHFASMFRRKPPQYRVPLTRRVLDLELVSARLIRAGFAGDYHSAFHGRGIEFSQVREYQPGDDVRTIDWNVTARTGVPHVKRFVEERELTVMLLVDASASTRFGTVKQLKSELAAELAALFAFSAITNNDKVGLVMFSDHVELSLPPKKGTRHVLRVIREVLSFQPTGRGT